MKDKNTDLPSYEGNNNVTIHNKQSVDKRLNVVGDSAISDLDNLTAGNSVYFMPTTLNIPKANVYGMCMGFSAYNSNWKFQIAFVTEGEIWLRVSIWGEAWGTWKQVI